MLSDESVVEDPIGEPETVVATSDGVAFFESRKGGKIAVHQSYMYMKNVVMKTGRIYYNCREKTAGCRGSLTLDTDGAVYGTATNNHVADPRMVAAEMAKAKFRKRAQRSHTKPRKLFSDMVQHLPNDVTGFLPAPHNMARTARRVRKAHLPTPLTRQEVDLDGYFEKGLLRPESLLWDSEEADPNRIILFKVNLKKNLFVGNPMYRVNLARYISFIPFKAEDFKYLRQAENWIMDGTFDIVPSLFTQLYTIHVELFKGVFPVVFGLLPDKSGITYDRMFKKIREVLETVPFEAVDNSDLVQKPYNIIVDYEKALMNSISKIFPRTNIQGKNN